jgi:putative membrane protein
VFGYTSEIFSVLISILGGAFLIRAFDIDRTLSNWSKPTPMGFIRMFTMVAGALLILSSIPAGINAVDSKLIESDVEFVAKITDKIVIGEFVAGALPILWIGLGAIFTGTLLSNWIGGISRQISDSLRIIVLVALYPVIAQFTNIIINDENSFTLIPPLLGGLAVTLVSATILFKKYRKHKHQEMVSD